MHLSDYQLAQSDEPQNDICAIMQWRRVCVVIILGHCAVCSVKALYVKGSQRQACSGLSARYCSNHADLLPKFAAIHTLYQDLPNRVGVATPALRSCYHALANTWDGNVRHGTKKTRT
jgi:hypothetical protein